MTILPTMNPNKGQRLSTCIRETMFGWRTGWLLFFSGLAFTGPGLHAAQHGLFTYEVVGGTEVKITDYPEEAAGPIHVPSSIGGLPVTTIANDSFYNCEGITEFHVPSSVTTIEYQAFYRCNSLTEFTIPATLTSFHENALYWCQNLRNIHVESGNPNYSSLDGVLFNHDQTSILKCPESKYGDYIIPESVTDISRNAFYACELLTSIRIPSGVVDVANVSFFFCDRLNHLDVAPGNTQLKSVDGVIYSTDESLIAKYPPGKTGPYSILPSATLIGDYAFYDCEGLTEISMPDGLTTIGGSAFGFCMRLTEVVLPESVTSIASYAFRSCHYMTSINLPHGLQRINDDTFSGCYSLLEIDIPASVTELGRNAFSRCDGLRTVHLHDGITLIEYGCFSYCTNLESINIPQGIETIDYRVFSNCDSLQMMVIPSSVTEILGSAFSYSDQLSTVVFMGDAPELSSSVFSGVPDVTSYYLSGSSGYDTSEWEDAVAIDLALSPAAIWLLEKGLAHDADLATDPDGDGVDLLTCYALNLDPVNPHPGMPRAVTSSGEMSMSFHASAMGVSYMVETSTDLTNWVTTGIELSEIQEDGSRTASTPMDAPSRYLRLALSQTAAP